MPFWTTETLRRRAPAENLIKSEHFPYTDDRVMHGAYELSMGPEAYITPTKEKKVLEPREHLAIPPGQFALLLTEEKIKVPKDSIAFISIKLRKKARGLVNVSGFHVDPGYEGRLKFSVYNAGSQEIRLARGEPVFLIWFASLDKPTEFPYNRNSPDHDEITPADIEQLQGEVFSPSGLKAELEKLRDEQTRRFEKIEGEVMVWRVATITLAIGLIVAILSAVYKIVMESKPSQKVGAGSIESPIGEKPRIVIPIDKISMPSAIPFQGKILFSSTDADQQTNTNHLPGDKDEKHH